MILDELIIQLRSYAPVFNQNVAGAMDFETGLLSVVNLPYPSAWVMPLQENAGPNTSLNELFQNVDERYAVVVEVSSVMDRRGQAAATGLPDLRAAIFAAILNWAPPSIQPNAGKAIYYVGFMPLTLDRARVFVQYEFGIETLITAADGFQITGTPLDDIQLTNTTADLLVDVPIATV